MIAQSGSVLRIDLDRSVVSIEADEVRLKQILLNLLSNAAKFTPKGGTVSLSIAPAADDAVEFRVTDSGIGMTPQEIETAFEVFGQVEGDATHKHQGTGLGLPIAGGACRVARAAR